MAGTSPAMKNPERRNSLHPSPRGGGMRLLIAEAAAEGIVPAVAAPIAIAHAAHAARRVGRLRPVGIDARRLIPVSPRAAGRDARRHRDAAGRCARRRRNDAHRTQRNRIGSGNEHGAAAASPCTAAAARIGRIGEGKAPPTASASTAARLSTSFIMETSLGLTARRADTRPPGDGAASVSPRVSAELMPGR